MDENPEDEQLPAPILDLRVAEVLEAQAHPNADRLMVLQIDLGGERRQIVAGIVAHYTPQDVVGLHIVVVANLEPARLRGEISQGMLLAAEDAEGRLGLLTAPDAEPGRRVAAEGEPSPAPSLTFTDFKRHELVAGPDGVRHDGRPVTGSKLVMDRGVFGRLR